MTKTASLKSLAFAWMAFNLVSCGTPPSQPTTSKVEPPATPTHKPAPMPVAITEASNKPLKQSNARSLEAYKVEIAEKILQANPDLRFSGPVPPMLRSVTVVGLKIDKHGYARPSIMRSAGLNDFDQVVLLSVEKANPLPAPHPDLLQGTNGIEYTETWLMREDRRFQIRAVSAPQIYGSR